MCHRFFVIFILLFVLSGCLYNDEPMPRITHDYTSPKVVPQPLKKPVVAVVVPDVPGSWIPSKGLEKKWTAIVIHHSATRNGSTALFDKWHKEKRHWDGVGYNFVIGNGTNTGDGQVEVTYRWCNQQVGAHCGGTRGNWANKDAIGICLVGNFNNTLPTQQQMRSLTKLIKFLHSRYGIPKSRIYGHKHTPGARVTDCPGKRFSVSGFVEGLDF